jgi:hypothetical protein
MSFAFMACQSPLFLIATESSQASSSNCCFLWLAQPCA